MNMAVNSEKIEKYSNILADEYKNLLIKETMMRSSVDNDISVRILLELDTEAKRTLVASSMKMRKRRRLIAVFGLVYIFIGFFMMLWYYIKKSGLLYEDGGAILLMSLIVSFIGMIVVMFSAVLRFNNDFERFLIKSKSEEVKIVSYSVIEKWRELESIISDLSERNTFTAPRAVISYLRENNFVDSKEEQELRRFLMIRNNIVHNLNGNISSSEIKRSIKEVEKIIVKLKRIL